MARTTGAKNKWREAVTDTTRGRCQWCHKRKYIQKMQPDARRWGPDKYSCYTCLKEKEDRKARTDALYNNDLKRLDLMLKNKQ